MTAHFRFLKVATAALAIAVTYVAASVGLAASALAFEVSSHSAVYDLNLSSTRDGNAPLQVRGIYSYSWERACDGWNVRQDSEIVSSYPGGQVINFAWSANSWESLGGEQLRFFTRRSDGPRGDASYRGRAEVDQGVGGLVQYQQPEGAGFELPSDTLFPTAHSLRVLAAADAGGDSFWQHVFDGTDPDDSLFEIFAVVGPWEEGTVPLMDHSAFAGLRSAQVNLAFYKPGEETGLPEQEQSFRIYENGVVDELYLDFGRFTLHAVLSELDLLDAPGC